jgi:hypothetical protein
MKQQRQQRQRTLSFKITEEAEQVLLAIRAAMMANGRDVTKTDVLEEAIRCLAAKLNTRTPPA